MSEGKPTEASMPQRNAKPVPGKNKLAKKLLQCLDWQSDDKDEISRTWRANATGVDDFWRLWEKSNSALRELVSVRKEGHTWYVYWQQYDEEACRKKEEREQIELEEQKQLAASYQREAKARCEKIRNGRAPAAVQNREREQIARFGKRYGTADAALPNACDSMFNHVEANSRDDFGTMFPPWRRNAVPSLPPRRSLNCWAPKMPPNRWNE